MTAQLTNRNKWSYCVGGLRDAQYNLVSMFLMVYVQYTIKLNALQFAAISAIMIVCKVWDAINDPMMGTIIENAKLKSGKFRPWIIIGALSNAVITLALFLVRLEGWAFVAFFGVMYLLWGMTFTMNDVGYWSMLPALSNDANERNLITTMMTIFTSIGAFAVAAVVPMITATDKAARYGLCAIAIVSLFVITQSITFFGVKEKERDFSKKAESITLVKMFKIIKNNDQLLWITLVLCCYYLGSGLLLQFGTNFCYFEFGYVEGGGIYMIFAVVYLVSTLISQVIFPKLVAKYKRKKVIAIGTCLAVFGYVVLMMFGYVLPKAVWVIGVAGFGIFAGQNLMYLCMLVQMTNTIEYNELRTGNRDESIVFSLRSFLAKFTSALQTGVVTMVLLVSGIFAATEGISELEAQSNLGAISSEAVISQAEGIISSTPSSALLILRVCMVLIPIILMVLAYVIGKAKYTITEEKYEEILSKLKEKKDAKENA
ncbi:MAG: MFS transporter [Clostridia bacterium]|nr:MFS transporter [Clostridia bacterium]